MGLFRIHRKLIGPIITVGALKNIKQKIHSPEIDNFLILKTINKWGNRWSKSTFLFFNKLMVFCFVPGQKAAQCCCTAAKRSATEETATAGRRGRMARRPVKTTWSSRSRGLRSVFNFHYNTGNVAYNCKFFSYDHSNGKST